MTGHDAKIILLARNLPFDIRVRYCNHLLMIPLHGLWSKSNNRTRGQFEYDVTLFFIYLFIYLFLISFVHMHRAIVIP